MQSVATRMVVDRENEIKAFTPEEYWNLDVMLDRVEKPGSIIARILTAGAAKWSSTARSEVNDGR